MISPRSELLVALALSLLLAMRTVACGGEVAELEAEPLSAAASPATSDGVTTSGTAGAAAPSTPPPQLEPSGASDSASTDKTAPKAASDPAPGIKKDPTPQTRGRSGAEGLFPELDLKGIAAWFNSEPLRLADQRGKVVLVDFWTYTCINCIRTFPYLREWHEKYADKGLVLVGVHTPEFEFEKLRANVRDAVEEFGIEYPVAMDNDYETWRAFSNRAWPAKYLMDKDGRVRYTHFGEGAYEETERKIRELLTEAGADVSTTSALTDPEPEVEPSARTRDPDTSLTRELYAGYGRNYGALVFGSTAPYILHDEYYQEKDADILYHDPGNRENHFIYLQGLWRNTEESLVHARQTEDYDDYIAIKFYATSVNAVLAPANSGSFRVRLTLDGSPLESDRSGADVTFDDEGNSYLLVDRARMYRIVDQPVFEGHELAMSSNSPEFALFAFTFGDYKKEGEPVP